MVVYVQKKLLPCRWKVRQHFVMDPFWMRGKLWSILMLWQVHSQWMEYHTSLWMKKTGNNVSTLSLTHKMQYHNYENYKKMKSKCTNICLTSNVCTANTDTRFGGVSALTRIHCSLYHTFEQMNRARLLTKAWKYLKNITLWAGKESIKEPTSKHKWCHSICMSTKWQLHDFQYITEGQQDVMCSIVLVTYSAMKSKTEIPHRQR